MRRDASNRFGDGEWHTIGSCSIRLQNHGFLPVANLIKSSNAATEMPSKLCSRPMEGREAVGQLALGSVNKAKDKDEALLADVTVKRKAPGRKEEHIHNSATS